eukprot:TRINITY_DN164_c0_g1_i1.p1 TRINITY_DN164_c0_g1~~TRINITY_DN164_c0_g1_i1.p1  ORF type:complete len:312 (-),score=49.96 TRINITY_DN164_c0_g1_i1:258-1193(-)
MNPTFVLLIAIVPVACLQTELKVDAKGATSDGSSAVAFGAGTGAIVKGDAKVAIDSSASRSSVVVSAFGDSTPKYSKPTPSKPYPKIVTQPVHKMSYTTYYHKCEDLKDDECHYIHKYTHCGYCALSKYPTKGYGCSYTEEVILKKKGDHKKEYDYETKVVPHCDCEGVYILDKYSCPSCDTLLKEIVECAGYKDDDEKIEVPADCLVKVGVSEKELVKCGFIESSHELEKEKTSYLIHKPVVAKKEKDDYKYDFKPVVKKHTHEPAPYVVKKDDSKVVVEKKPTYAASKAFGTAFGKSTATATAISGKHD